MQSLKKIQAWPQMQVPLFTKLINLKLISELLSSDKSVFLCFIAA